MSWVASYWEKRYLAGRLGSGRDSMGERAKAKAEFVNDVIDRHKVRSIVDWGCGNGEVAQWFRVNDYMGLDVSPAAVALARSKGLDARQFDGFDDPGLRADLALSLDVLYHLIEEDYYQRHIALVFGSASLVCIRAANRDEAGRAHVLHRAFLKDVPREFQVVVRPKDTQQIGMWLFRGTT